MATMTPVSAANTPALVPARISSRATLRRLREARALIQSTDASMLDMDRSEISRLKRRSDTLLSTTLMRFVQPPAE